MSNGSRPKPTPLPVEVTNQFMAMNTTLATISANVQNIKDEQLPEIKKDLKEARDTALVAKGAIERHLEDEENTDSRLKVVEGRAAQCEKGKHCQDVETIETKQKTAGWAVKTAIGIATAVGIALTGFVVQSIRTEESMSKDISSVQEDLGEHEKRQREDMKSILTAIEEVPQVVVQEQAEEPPPIPTEEQIERLISKLPRQQKRRILEDYRKARDYHIDL